MTTAIAGGKPSRLRRTDAAVALAALVAAVVYVAVSAVSRWYVLLESIVSLGVTVIAAWYVLSRRGTSRAIAGVVAALALLVLIAAMVASESIIVLVVGLALAAVSASLRGGGTRERLDRGVLGIAFARVDTAVEAEKLAALEAAGRVQRLWQTFLEHPIGTR